MNGIISTSAVGVLVTVIAIFPGFVGEAVYAGFAGRGWLEKDFRAYLRILGFSFIGLLIYGVLANQYSWAAPIHIEPATYTNSDFASSLLPGLSIGIFGHILMSMLLGCLAGSVMMLIRKNASGLIGHQDVWDSFVTSFAPKRWVVVTLSDDASYAGMIKQADISRKPEYRDIILLEPALYESETNNYRATNIQFMYIRGDLIASMIALSKKDDKRETTIGELIFHEVKPDEKPAR